MSGAALKERLHGAAPLRECGGRLTTLRACPGRHAPHRSMFKAVSATALRCDSALRTPLAEARPCAG